MTENDDLQNIEEWFKESWDFVEANYNKNLHSFGTNPEILKLIRDLRSLGYDSYFLAGTSVFDFILSRSKQYGCEMVKQGLVFTYGQRV